jgi:hypothetical protein
MTTASAASAGTTSQPKLPRTSGRERRFDWVAVAGTPLAGAGEGGEWVIVVTVHGAAGVR